MNVLLDVAAVVVFWLAAVAGVGVFVLAALHEFKPGGAVLDRAIRRGPAEIRTYTEGL